MKHIGLIFILIVFYTLASRAQQAIPIDPLPHFQSELREPVKIRPNGDHGFFIDFGKDAFGTLLLHFPSPQRDTVVIHLGEKLTATGNIDRHPDGTLRYQKIILPLSPEKSDYLIQLPADKRNTTGAAVALPDSFGVIMPFRYCELEHFNLPVSKKTIRQKVFHLQFDDNASDFSCSDSVLNKVWDLCKYTIKSTSFCGIYIDGDRERIPYEADAFINQLSHYCVDQEYGMARQTNEYFMHHPTWPTEWILHTVLLFYYDYLYTGDPTALQKNWEALKIKTLMELEREDGLISSKSPALTDDLMKRLGFKDYKQRLKDIVDWPPAQKDTGWKLATNEGERDGYEMKDVNTVVNAFHYEDLKLMALLARYLNKPEDALLFSQKANLVRKAIQEKLFDRQRGIFVDGEHSSHASIHANLFALAFDLVPQGDEKTVTALIKSRGMACSVYGSQFLLEGLYKAGEAGWAYQLMTSRSDRSWWNMLQSGATMTMEAWDMKYKPNSDWNHAWGAAPANIITRWMWGIQPVEPGFKHAMIKPQLDPLTSSNIKAPTPLGPIVARFKKLGPNTCQYVIKIPNGMIANLNLQHIATGACHLNGKKTKLTNGTLRLKEGDNLIDLR